MAMVMTVTTVTAANARALRNAEHTLHGTNRAALFSTQTAANDATDRTGYPDSVQSKLSRALTIR